MKLGSIVKLARGSLGADEMGELLASMGIDLSFTPVAIDQAAFRDLAIAATEPGCTLLKLSGRMKSGESIAGLMVMNQG